MAAAVVAGLMLDEVASFRLEDEAGLMLAEVAGSRLDDVAASNSEDVAGLRLEDISDSRLDDEARSAEVKTSEELDCNPMTTVMLNVYVDDPFEAVT